MTATEIKSARCTRAEFGRLVGLSAMRITQLCRAGLIEVDAGGVKLLESLKAYYSWRALKENIGWTVEGFLRAAAKRRQRQADFLARILHVESFED